MNGEPMTVKQHWGHALKLRDLRHRSVFSEHIAISLADTLENQRVRNYNSQVSISQMHGLQLLMTPLWGVSFTHPNSSDGRMTKKKTMLLKSLFSAIHEILNQIWWKCHCHQCIFNQQNSKTTAGNWNCDQHAQK